MFPYSIETREISEKISLFYFDIEHTDDLEAYLDAHLPSICYGRISPDNIKNTKNALKGLFERKSDAWIHGAIAELFVHLFLNHQKYEQEFLFMNLEEGSLKKGFDGLYSKQGIMWLVESKSGKVNANTNISHYGKVKAAYKDIANKVSGYNNANNPWRNAYNHASHFDAGSTKSLREKLKKLSDDYVNKNYHRIDNFNIIPAATLFYEGVIQHENLGDLGDKILGYFQKVDHSDVNVVCISNNAKKDFLKYIDI